MYICAVGCMCAHLCFYHVWICLQNNLFHFHSSDCSVVLQSPPSKNPVIVDLSFYSRWLECSCFPLYLLWPDSWGGKFQYLTPKH